MFNEDGFRKALRYFLEELGRPTPDGKGPLPRIRQGPLMGRAEEGRDLSSMCGIPADISYRLLPV
jgi:hypothetical protein